MLLGFFSLLIFHSLSYWKFINSQKKSISSQGIQHTIDQIGFHQIDYIQDGDSIEVKFNQRLLRLFIIFMKTPAIELSQFDIDGSNTLEKVANSSEKVAYSIDATNNAIFKFKSIKDKDKPQRPPKTIKMHSKHDHDFDHDDYFEYQFSSASAQLWLLPRDMCGKSSLFEYGGTGAKFSVKTTNGLLSSQNKDEVTYANCIFSPLFEANNSYIVSTTIKPSNFESFISSHTKIYTDDINRPDFAIDFNQNDQNLTVSKPFFVKYEISQKAPEGEFNSPPEVETVVTRKVTGNYTFNFDIVGFFCISGAFEFCTKSSCFHDDEIERTIISTCENENLKKLIQFLIGGFLLLLLVVIAVCWLCCGCCCCCGCWCCFWCALCQEGGCLKRKGRSQVTTENSNTPSQNLREQRRRRREEENDLEVPLMDVGQQQPEPVYNGQAQMVNNAGFAVNPYAYPGQMPQQQGLQVAPVNDQENPQVL